MPTLTPLEQRIIHRTEQLLYGALLIMPLSGFLYVMAGNYGVRLFGLWDLPNPIGPAPLTAGIALWVHVACAMLLLLPIGTHLGLVLGHHFGLRDRSFIACCRAARRVYEAAVCATLTDAAEPRERHRSTIRSHRSA